MITVAKTAPGNPTDLTRMKTYIYKLNFQCLGNSIEEADACFAENASLLYQKTKPPHLCPLITVEVVSPPKHPEIVEDGRS